MASSGAGSRLPTSLLVVAGMSALVAVLVSTVSILLHLRNYRKPALQRWVVCYRLSSMEELMSFQNGCPYHGHGTYVCDSIADIVILGRGSVLH
jgi:hypothetical protein